MSAMKAENTSASSSSMLAATQRFKIKTDTVRKLEVSGTLDQKEGKMEGGCLEEGTVRRGEVAVQRQVQWGGSRDEKRVKKPNC